MRKIQMMLIICLFCLGGIISSQASVQDNHDRACARRCREQAREAKSRCRALPEPQRRACLREVEARLRECLSHCRD